MHRPEFPPWLSLCGLMAQCLSVVACGSAAESRAVEAVPDEPPTAVLAAASVVEHEPQQLAPVVQWRSGTVERAAMSLTAGDGSGLALRSITGTVVIEDPLAFTELRLVFENPEPRRREGRFEFGLPTGAALSRLAMRIGNRWMEGEVVERSKGQQTFERFVHERPRVDPALLETAGANRVSARVFPIAPHERKEIIVSYSQPLTAGQDDYRLPLQGLPKLDALDVRVMVKTATPGADERHARASQQVVEVRERDFSPTEDMVIDLEGARDAAALRSDQLVAVRVQPVAERIADPIDSLTVLFDTSASSAASLDREVDRLAVMLEALGDTPVRVVAFDQTVERIGQGAAATLVGEPLAALRERRAFGASDLVAALSDPVVTRDPSPRLLVWSDGVITAGAEETTDVTEAAAGTGSDRIDAYASSTGADRTTLAALVGGGTRTGFVLGPDVRGASMAHDLSQVGFDDVDVQVVGAKWSYPTTLDGLAPGDDFVVYAGFEDGAPANVRVQFSDARLPTHVVPTLVGAAPLLERAAAVARVEQLQAQRDEAEDAATAAEITARMTALAESHRILTPDTALLVLENEREYRRYGIDRSALADILTIGVGGVELLRRGSGPTARPLPPVDSLVATARRPTQGLSGLGVGNSWRSSRASRRAVEDDEDVDVWGALQGTEVGEASGVGGLGLLGARADSLGMVGTGRGGGGVGEGTIGLGNIGLIGRGGGSGSGSGMGYGRGASGLGGRGHHVPRVRVAKATVTGALDADIIRRIIRQHINEVRYCYQQQLEVDPSLAGRVSVRFSIAANGKVSASTVDEDGLTGPAVGQCIAKAVHRWRFPAPAGGGTVRARIPFELRPGRDVASSWRSQRPRRPRSARRTRRRGDPSDGPQWVGTAQSGRFASLQRLVAAGANADARHEAWAWATSEPDNALALVALGEMLELDKRPRLAARVYGSLIDLHPERADMRRTAAARLEAVGAFARPLALESYRKAVAQRPDQINGHRLLAWALAKDGDFEGAFTTLTQALQTQVPGGRFAGVKALLRQDRELVAAAWLAASPEHDPRIAARLTAAGVRPASQPSLRLVAAWETDATDVDLLVDPLGRGQGRRHADVRTGFGPEAWVARGGARPAAVTARVRYFDRGAMGYAMGTVSAISHDGQGRLTFTDRPFILMEAVGSVELGRFAA